MSLNDVAQLPRRLRALLAQARSRHDADRGVHFHSGDQGRPFVCENPHCSSPRLDIAGPGTSAT